MIDRVWLEEQLPRARRWQDRARREARAARKAERLNARWAAESARMRRSAAKRRHAGRAPTQVDESVTDPGPARARAQYARARARSLATERSAMVAACGSAALAVRCQCGIGKQPVGCRQVILCDRCRVPYYKRIRRRAYRAIQARYDERVGAWKADGSPRGGAPVIVLVTLTIPRMLDGRRLTIAERHKRLTRGWEGLRKWLHRRIGQFPYICLPEITPGADRSGHLHYHAVCIWPWWDWADAQDEWRRATGLPDANPPDMLALNGARTAAHYVAKYATKGADCDDGRMTPELMGEFVAAYYGKRRISPSEGFWIPLDPPRCPCCGQPLEVIEKPLSRLDPRAIWRARRALSGVQPGAIQAPRDWLQVSMRVAD